MPKIKITLKSDLCAASGQGFSSVIDTDVSYDKYGFPYIGARRLKGCLRDAAEYIGNKNIADIFGITGSDKSGALKLSNAVLPDHDDMCCELDEKKHGIAPQQIIDLYTYTKAQTQIEGDTAKDNSLRFTRVVKHYSPLTDRETEFYAECECGTYAKDMEDICRALRNIGFKRSRGLGAVKCEFDDNGNEKYENLKQYNANIKYCIQYTVKLTDSLMMSSNADDVSCTYISGTGVLGALAGSYLKNGSAKDELFEDLFLSGKAIYSNLYISDKNCMVSVPSPMFFGRIKSADAETDGKIISLLDSKNEKLTVKPLKDKFIDSSFQVKEVLTETVYHHSRRGDMLYTQTCICAGQYFSGSIICRGSHVKTITELLNSGDLRFGKSKTAQYSKCKVINCFAELYQTETTAIEADKSVIIALESDMILTDEYGNNSIDTGLLCRELGFSASALTCKTVLQYKTVNGYNAKWNLRKPSLRAFAQGSVVVFRTDKAFELEKIQYKGEKNNEGFGRIRLYTEDEIRIEDAPEKIAEEFENISLRKIANLIKTNGDLEKIKLDAIRFAENNKGKFKEDKLNAAFTGRILLMIDQADTFDNLMARVESIKSKEKQDLVVNMLKDRNSMYWREFLQIVFTLGKYQLKTEKVAKK